MRIMLCLFFVWLTSAIGGICGAAVGRLVGERSPSFIEFLASSRQNALPDHFNPVEFGFGIGIVTGLCLGLATGICLVFAEFAHRIWVERLRLKTQLQSDLAQREF
jgi:hypothetical protein